MAARSGPQIILRGSGNATVPPDYPILPPQAGVDNIPTLLNVSVDTLNLSGKGITSIDGATVNQWAGNAKIVNGGFGLIDLSDNSLSVASVDDILENLDPSLGQPDNPTINLSGQTPAAPPTLNCMSVAGAGTTATNGAYTPRGTVNGKEFYNLIGQPDSTSNWTIAWADFATGSGVTWGITDGTASLLYFSLDDVATPDLVTTWITAPSGGSPVPSVTAANAAKVQRVAAGWTVTTD